MLTRCIHLLIAAASYYVAGRFGLMLAIPPGFASAVWPATGAALACMLLLKPYASLAGIVLGSFILNLGITTQNYSNFSLMACLPALAIATGTGIQTFVGYGLWRKLIGTIRTLDAPKHIVLFVALITPLSCLVAATVGTSVLFFSGFIQATNISFTWLTWWAGDAIGLILFTPLITTLFSREEITTSRRKAIVSAPTVLVFMGILGLFFTSLQVRHNSIQDLINDQALRAGTLIHEQLTTAQKQLQTYTSVYKVKPSLNRTEFNLIAADIINNEVALQALGWSPLVKQEQRLALEAALQEEGFSDFGLTELDATHKLIVAKQRAIHYPVIYIHPLAENKAAFGLDLAANAARLQALNTAIFTGRAVSTEPISLAQNDVGEKSIILYLPIFNQDYETASHTPQYAQTHLNGFISGVFNITKLLEKIMGSLEGLHLALQIEDVTEAQAPISLVSATHQPLQQFEPVVLNYEFGQRALAITIYADDRFKFSAKDWTSWIILTVGFLLAAMLQSLLFVLTGNTERIKLQVKEKTQAYLLAKEAAEQASIAKSNFLATISHEFRTPLNAIIGFTGLCLKTELTTKQKSFLDKVALSSETLLSLIVHTLDYANIESKKVKLEKGVLNIEHIAQKIDAIYSMQAEQKSVVFETKVETLPAHILIGDPLRIEQILLNICGNAVKYTEKGHIWFSIAVKNVDSDHNLSLDQATSIQHPIILCIAVKDTGIGIAPEHKEKIFDVFQQADSSLTRNYDGIGLGLSITRKLVELMGGTIRVESQLGIGSTFTIYIPLSIGGDHEY